MTSGNSELRRLFDEAFQHFYDTRYGQQDELGRICRYVLEGPGKRVRALLCLQSCEACGGSPEMAMPAAIAIEMVHAYSLVHDDLPCMDDDHLRRGRPTAHVQFDEAGALLAGDALLTDAFALLSDPGAFEVRGALEPGPLTRLSWVQELANAAGSRGMVGGQMLDLHWTTQPGADRPILDRIHALKTGMLIGAACAMGGMAASTSDSNIEKLRDFGKTLGLAFQIVDDLLDEHDGTGKSKGKDREAGKLTYLSALSAKDAEAFAGELTVVAGSLLSDIEGDTKALVQFSQELLGRQK